MTERVRNEIRTSYEKIGILWDNEPEKLKNLLTQPHNLSTLTKVNLGPYQKAQDYVVIGVLNRQEA